MIEIKSTTIYEEVNNLAKKNGYQLELIEEHINVNACGTHEVDEQTKRIKITVDPRYNDNLGIGTHELYHAKLFLEGFPKLRIYPYNRGDLHLAVEKSIQQIENIAQHSIIYPELAKQGFSMEKLDNDFFEGVRSQIDLKFEGINLLKRAFDLLECYYRTPNEFSTIENQVCEKQNQAYGLFMKMRRFSKKTSTPFEMRMAMGNMLKLVDEIFKKEIGKDLYLRYFTYLDPIFNDYQLNQKASKTLKIINFNEVPDTFIIGKEDDICIRIFQGKSPFIVESIESITLKEFLDI